jgi:hypothetical protein
LPGGAVIINAIIYQDLLCSGILNLICGVAKTAEGFLKGRASAAFSTGSHKEMSLVYMRLGIRLTMLKKNVSIATLC